MFNLDRYVFWQEWLDNNTERETMGIVHDPHYTAHRLSPASQTGEDGHERGYEYEDNEGEG